MGNKWLCAALSLCMFASGYAKVLFKEDFSAKTISGGGEILEESLNYKYHPETGGRLRIKDNQLDGVSFKPACLSEAQEQPVYISFLMRSLNEDCKNKFGGIMLYKNGEEVFGAGNDYGSDNFRFWTADRSPVIMGDIRRLIRNDVHMVVIKINPAGSDDAEVSVALDPMCRRSIERQPKQIWNSVQAELSFDEIRLRCGEVGCEWEFDELVIADSWQDIVTADDEPSELVKELQANATATGTAEMLFDNVARFYAAGVDIGKLPPSMALQRQFKAVSKLKREWNMRPKFASANGRKYAFFDIPPETDLYGTGEVTGTLMRNGYRIDLENKDRPQYGDQESLYQSHPWVMGVREDGSSFGILFDTTWISQLDLRDGIVFSVPENAPNFPVIVVEGKSPQEIMQALADLIGTISMPPRWAIGYHQCRWSYYPDARVREIADTFREKEIPCDVIWFDIHYMEGNRIFTVDKNHFPDPKSTNDYLHSLGYKSVWMVDPGVKLEEGYSVYDSGTAEDVWVKNADGSTFTGWVHPGECVFPDFTSPRTRDWWGGLYKDFMAMGVDGAWNDMNEPFAGGWPNATFPNDTRHEGGGELPPGTHEQYHNTYGMLMARASLAGILKTNPDKRPFVLTRANFLGGQRYAATWTGDNDSTWQHMKWSVPMSLTLGLSGQPFSGPDIGGIDGDCDAELWGHWIASGAFYPFSRAHTAVNTANQEPWEFGEEVETAARIALQRRYRIMPYLYTAFVDAAHTGIPVMQPVFFADPADKTLRMEDGAFMVGSDLLVVPKWATDAKLPKGIWRRISLVGEDSASDKYQCDVYARGGSVIALGPVLETTAQIPAIQQLTLLVVPDENGRAAGTLYEDSGEGFEYKNGEYLRSTFIAKNTGERYVVRCTDQSGKLALKSRIVKVKVVEDGIVFNSLGDVLCDDGVTIVAK